MTTRDITFRTRPWAEPEDHDADGPLFGGSPPRRTDAEAAVRATVRPGSRRAVCRRGL